MKYCIITGANSGIGRSAAFQIAEKGHAVILACRNYESAEITRKAITEQTGNKNVYSMKVDLSLLSQVRDFINEYKKKFDSLDVIINNAADFDISRKCAKITEEGHEAQFATNVLAPHALSVGLIELLKKSGDGRIINISSKGLVLYPGLKLDYDNLNAEKKYNPSKTYYQNKLALMTLSLKLRRDLEGSSVGVYAVRVPNVKVDMERYKNVSSFMQAAYRIKSKSSISPEEMAEVYTELALGGKKEGFYFDEDCSEVPVNKFALIKEEQDKLWEIVSKLI